MSEIVLGIDEAKQRLKESERDHWVSPPITLVGAGHAIHDSDVGVEMPDGKSRNKANLVRFDVAIHATESSEAGGALQIAVAKLGGAVTTEQASISRIKFDIPLIIAQRQFLTD